MVAIAPSSVSTRIQHILLTTAHHFSIRSRSETSHDAAGSDWADPLPLRWTTSSRVKSEHGEQRTSK